MIIVNVCLQQACSCCNINHMQHRSATWCGGAVQLLILTDLIFDLFIAETINQWRKGGNQSRGRKPSMMSCRKGLAKASKWKPQGRLEPTLQHCWQAWKADVLNPHAPHLTVAMVCVAWWSVVFRYRNFQIPCFNSVFSENGKYLTVEISRGEIFSREGGSMPLNLLPALGSSFRGFCQRRFQCLSILSSVNNMSALEKRWLKENKPVKLTDVRTSSTTNVSVIWRHLLCKQTCKT